MNFLQIVNRMRQDSGITGADLASVTGQSGESQRVINWCNEAWLDLQAMRQDWLWLRKPLAFPTIAGQSTYSPTQLSLSDFGMWDIDSFRNYANPTATLSIGAPCVVFLQDHRLAANDTVIWATTGALPTGLAAGTTYYVISVDADHFQLAATVNGSAITTSGTQSGVHTLTSSNTTTFSGLKSEIFMGYSAYDDWRNTYQYGAVRSVKTRPNDITTTPALALALGPVPDAGYTIVGDYYSAPSELVANTDTPALPAKFHLAIVYKAMISYGMYEAATEVVQRGQMETDKWMRRIHVDQMPDITTGGSLA